MFPIQVESKGDADCFAMCGPTIHNKRTRIGTQLATNELSQAAKDQGKTVTVANNQEDAAGPGEVHDTQFIALHICCFRGTRANNEGTDQS